MRYMVILLAAVSLLTIPGVSVNASLDDYVWLDQKVEAQKPECNCDWCGKMKEAPQGAVSGRSSEAYWGF